MANHALLDNVTHKDLKVHVDYRPGAGFDVNVARVFPGEFGVLQAEYPLFFSRNADSGDFDAVALLGFGSDENLFLDNGRWDARYMPMSIERQPFLIGMQQQDQDGVPTEVPVVHIDLDHPGVGADQGQRVFLEHGGESPYLERMTSLLHSIHQGHADSRSLSRLLVGLELVESMTLDVTFAGGREHSVKGLYTINQDKLRTLNAEALAALHEHDHLKDIYMMLASLASVSLLISRKNRRLAAEGGS